MYVDTFNTHTDCKEEKKKVDKACKPEPEQTEQDKKDKKPAKKKGLMAAIGRATYGLDEVGRTATGYKRNADNAWVDSHCEGMWIKPKNLKAASEDINKAAKEAMEKIQKEKWSMVTEAVSELSGLAIDKAGSAAAKKVAGLVARSAVKNIIGGAAVIGTAGTVGTLLEAGMLLWTAADVLSTAAELAAMAGPEGLAVLGNIQDAMDIKGNAQAMLNDYTNHPDKALADSMTLMSKFNRCLQAKRCQLVQMSKTAANDAAKTGKGCCPGQTGHHLLPREMFRPTVLVPKPGEFVKSGINKGNPKMQSVPDPDECKEYTDSVHNNAPVVCVEGATHSHATHGLIHDRIDDLMEDHRMMKGDKITTDEAIKAGIKSHQDTFQPKCEEKCLAAQLHQYYDNLCKDQLKPRGGKGHDAPVAPPAGPVGLPTTTRR